ncbi:hypothetical protein C8J57DRAFT_1224948 [Mycena rebaudengoi]|nr:hypothetical protein C8J57DRAFT_1224948 [Mycena rebaudengoi]
MNSKSHDGTYLGSGSGQLSIGDLRGAQHKRTVPLPHASAIRVPARHTPVGSRTFLTRLSYALPRPEEEILERVHRRKPQFRQHGCIRIQLNVSFRTAEFGAPWVDPIANWRYAGRRDGSNERDTVVCKGQILWAGEDEIEINPMPTGRHRLLGTRCSSSAKRSAPAKKLETTTSQRPVGPNVDPKGSLLGMFVDGDGWQPRPAGTFYPNVKSASGTSRADPTTGRNAASEHGYAQVDGFGHPKEQGQKSNWRRENTNICQNNSAARVEGIYEAVDAVRLLGSPCGSIKNPDTLSVFTGPGDAEMARDSDPVNLPRHQQNLFGPVRNSVNGRKEHNKRRIVLLHLLGKVRAHREGERLLVDDWNHTEGDILLVPCGVIKGSGSGSSHPLSQCQLRHGAITRNYRDRHCATTVPQSHASHCGVDHLAAPAKVVRVLEFGPSQTRL